MSEPTITNEELAKLGRLWRNTSRGVLVPRLIAALHAERLRAALLEHALRAALLDRAERLEREAKR